MTDRGWKAAPTVLDCFGVLEWWGAGVMEIANHKQQISKKTMIKFIKGIWKNNNLL